MSRRIGWSIGTVVIVAGVLVLLAWIPLRQLPGLGTVSNVVLVGLSIDGALRLLPTPEPLAPRIGYLAGGVVLCGVATGLYIGANFGPGPRDGLMTGLVRRTGWSIRSTRTGIEATVLLAGYLLGGTVGVGTVAYALAIGPLAQIFLPLFSVGADGADRAGSVVLVVRAGEPGSQAVDRDFEVRMSVDEHLQSIGEPGEADLLASPALRQLLYSPVGEIHRYSLSAG